MTFKSGWPSHPDPAREQISALRRMTKSARYEDLFDAADEFDEERELDPTRPPDKELIA